jgi:hypothetical protein
MIECLKADVLRQGLCQETCALWSDGFTRQIECLGVDHKQRVKIHIIVISLLSINHEPLQYPSIYRGMMRIQTGYMFP